jgi:hypothetical protein
MAKQPKKKLFAIGAKVRVLMPGVNGIVIQADDAPSALGEYWHTVETEHGNRKEPGCNLELVPRAIGREPEPTAAVIHAQFVAFFRSLELALDEHKQKGTPTGDPVYQRIYEQLTGDLAAIGIGQDQIEHLAAQCGHGTTLARLERLRKKPVGFSA